MGQNCQSNALTKDVKGGQMMTANEEMKEEAVEGKPDMSQYTCMDDFRADIKLIFDNARTFNSKETIYYKYAQQLEALIKPMLNRLRDTQPAQYDDIK